MVLTKERPVIQVVRPRVMNWMGALLELPRRIEKQDVVRVQGLERQEQAERPRAGVTDKARCRGQRSSSSPTLRAQPAGIIYRPSLDEAKSPSRAEGFGQQSC